MEPQVERKISLLHSSAGIILGIISGIYIKSGNLNLINVLFLGLVASYPLKILTQRLFNLSAKEFLIKDWLTKGFFLFFTVWIVVWIFIYNLKGF